MDGPLLKTKIWSKTVKYAGYGYTPSNQVLQMGKYSQALAPSK
jgi:hypothetical protein